MKPSSSINTKAEIEAMAIFIKNIYSTYYCTGIAQHYYLEKLLTIGKKLGGNQISLTINDLPEYKKSIANLSYEKRKTEELKRLVAPNLITSIDIEGLRAAEQKIWDKFLKDTKAFTTINVCLDKKWQMNYRPKNIAKTITCTDKSLVCMTIIYNLSVSDLSPYTDSVWNRLALQMNQDNRQDLIAMEKVEYPRLLQERIIKGQKKELEKAIQEIDMKKKLGTGRGGVQKRAEIYKI